MATGDEPGDRPEDRPGDDPEDQPGDDPGDDPGEGPLVWPGCEAAVPDETPVPEEEPPGPRSRLRRTLVAGIAVTGLVLATVSVVAVMRDGAPGHRRHPALTAPDEGPVRIRAVGSDLCLGERRGSPSGQVHQRDCADADVPSYALERLGSATWRIVTDHPDHGPGCAGIPGSGRIPGAALEDAECGDPTRVEGFVLAPYGTPVTGWRILPAGSAVPGGCVTVVGDPKAAWASLAQAPCRPDARGQLFSFDRRD
ncbi:RICIN domain-containing protein [Streptomyces sp. NPDC004788]